MDDTEKLEVTAGAVKRAAEKCENAKEILKELFPEVFKAKEKWEDVTMILHPWCCGDGLLIRDADTANLPFELIPCQPHHPEFEYKVENNKFWRRRKND